MRANSDCVRLLGDVVLANSDVGGVYNFLYFVEVTFTIYQLEQSMESRLQV